MQDYLPMLESIAADWYRLTLANQEYAITLIVAVWLLTAIFYSIRIGFLNGRFRRLAAALQQLQSELAEAKLQIEGLQQQLTESGEQVSAANAEIANRAQLIDALEQQMLKANQRLADANKGLAANFGLPVPGGDGGNPEEVWDQHRQITEQLNGVLAAERQAKADAEQAREDEAAKVGEKEALLGALRARVESQTQQIGELEAALAEQQRQAQQQRIDAARVAELEAKLATATAVKAVPAPAPAPVTAVKSETPAPVSERIGDSVRAAVEPEKPAVVASPVAPIPAPKPVEISAPEPIVVAKPVEPPRPVVVEPASGKPAEPAGGGLKKLFGSTMQKFAKLDEKFGGSTPRPTVAEAEPTPAPSAEPAPEPIAPTVAADKPAEKPAAGGAMSKFKGLLGKGKSEANADDDEAEPLIEQLEAATADAMQAAEKAKGQLRGLFGKFGKKG
ncbi:hypothetical protein HC024_17510 [Methylococcaceae bacterium WWC4]|uniref:hypothetical protein n=1 Tax=Methylomonas sp. LWB TaxID=1905845 RepID=UPI0008D90CA2|nr:hypothetical protein [Methylomonas sp. LWB]NJA07510.1 hypothetical protein [Methylococcaceae bacterium WWC4]OHX37861.1 hypothetical protein BJL95_04630 [Methylomonas sp. LWB]